MSFHFFGNCTKVALLLLCLLVLAAALACSSEPEPVLKVGGVPDQDTARLARRYQIFADYLAKELDVEVEYVPSADYAAVVTAFRQDELQLAFFGALTGVQARLQNPGAVAIAQREEDATFHTKFVARPELGLSTLEDIKPRATELTITFGSESSTSGHLMPRHFLTEAGISPDEDFRAPPSFSGSHDKTWQLVQSGSYDIGALSEAVWKRAVSDGKVDPAAVSEFHTTPEYFDYNWTVQGNLDQLYESGFTAKLQTALLKLNPQEHGDILELFSTEKFIETNNANYRTIEDVARGLGMIR